MAPPANGDLPQAVRRDYDEAATILARSPRGAAGLLRLALQRLVEDLTGRAGSINELIGDLVKKGLPERVQKAMDVLRVVGNNALHPGQIFLEDDHETALALFNLVNVVAQRMISEERQIDSMYDSLPEPSRKAIEERDRPRTT